MAEGIVGHNLTPALRRTENTMEGFLEIEGAVVVGDYVARRHMFSHRDLEIEPPTEAHGGTGMIHRHLPWSQHKNALAATVQIRIKRCLWRPLHNGGKIVERGQRNDLVELIARPM